MKRAIIIILILIGMNFGMQAQDDGNCSDDRNDLVRLAQAVVDAEGDDAVLDAIDDLRFASILHYITCVGVVPNDYGVSRAAPVPAGNTDIVQGRSYLATLGIVGQHVLTDEAILDMNMFNDVARDGFQIVSIDMSISCADEVSTSCTLSFFDFEVVGSSGRVYPVFRVTSDEYPVSVEFFGGSGIEYSVLFELPEDETDLILLVGDGDQTVYFEVGD